MFWRTLVRDRRIWLIVLLAIVSVVISRFSITGQTAIRWVVKGGYWAMLLTVALWGRSFWRSVGPEERRMPAFRSWAWIAALIGIVGAVLLAHEKYGYKVLADEELLAGTSMSMHLDREVAYPVRATDIQGPFQILQRVLDKRPFFYPFLVSLAHDFTGYRPENAFLVNSVLGFLFLALLFIIGRRLGGSEWAGVFVVLLFGGLPLLAQQMAGGGFELLNLTMICAVLLLGIRLCGRLNEATLEAFCLSAILLAYTRYESALFLVPVALLVLWCWWREQRIVLSWPLIVTPVLLVFALLQNRVFSVNAGAWELAGKPGATVPFGLQYVGENLGHALAFFFDTTGYQPNSPFFAAVGLASVPFFGLWMVRVVREPGRAKVADFATVATGLGLFGVWALLLVYFWGQFDDPLIRRLSLPVHLLMAIAAVTVGGLWLRRRGWQVASAAALAAMVVYSLPSMSRRAYAVSYSPAVEMEWRTDFLKRFPERDYLFIDNDATFWISNKVPATPAKQARERQEGLIFHLRNDTFSSMYVLQHFKVDPTTGAQKLEPSDDIGPDFVLEPFWERRIETLFIGRISRIKAIKLAGKTAAEAKMVPAGVGEASWSGADYDRAKKAYIDNWLKQLP